MNLGYKSIFLLFLSYENDSNIITIFPFISFRSKALSIGQRVSLIHKLAFKNPEFSSFLLVYNLLKVNDLFVIFVIASFIVY